MAFIKSVGYVRQTRILIVRDEKGRNITPDEETFGWEGTFRQPGLASGDKEKDDIQAEDILLDMEMTAQDMSRYKRGTGVWKTACTMSSTIPSGKIDLPQKVQRIIWPSSGNLHIISSGLP